MAGQKETPRQKMIGMLYLVLTALLALNVSKDILDAFVVVNDGLEMNLGTYEDKNRLLYAEMNLAKSVDTEKALPFWEDAQKVKTTSEEINSFIQDLKVRLIMETENVDQSVADSIDLKNVEKKDDYDTPTNIMIGSKEDASEGKAKELRDQLESFSSDLSAILTRHGIEKADLGIKIEDDEALDGEGIWQIKNFYHTPLAGAITILSKLQNDVRNAEYHTLNRLLEAMDTGTIPFDTVAARVMPLSNYVLLGEEYKADVFLAAFSKTQKPEMLIGNWDETTGALTSVSDSLPVHLGMGDMTAKTDREGMFTYNGVINYTMESGEIKSFPFQSDYIVAKPSLVVSATKVNVLYKGITNPIEISVPGVPSENIVASVSGGNSLRKIRNGVYEVDMIAGSPRQVFVNVSAKTPDGTIRNMGRREFRGKRLPKPYGKISMVTTTASKTKNWLCSQQGIGAEYSPDFEFDLKAKVKSFEMQTKVRSTPIDEKAKGPYFTEAMREVMCNLKPGSKVTFHKIKAVGDDGVVHELSPIIITIK